MTKSIVLHGLAPDNAGNYHPAGSTLAVSDDLSAGCIAEKRAAELVDIGSAAPAPEKAEKKATADA